MKRILVTGAAGFIGSHLALHLHSKKFFVIGYDNFNSYYDVNLKRAREKKLQEQGIEIFPGDIREKGTLKKLISDKKISHVIHLAAQAGIRHSFLHPEEYVASNLEGFVSVLEACTQSPIKQLIYASSSSVYGLNTKIPFSPSDRTDHPANLYGATKKANELIAFAYHNLYKLPMIGLRFFTVYGPWGRPDMAYFLFTKKILEGSPIELFNHGQMKRDFTYIDDIVQGISSSLDCSDPFGIFNLGNSHPHSLFDLLSELETALGKQAIKKLLPLQKGEVLETFADISLSQEKLHYSPKISLKEGISRFVSWYLDFYKKTAR